MTIHPRFSPRFCAERLASEAVFLLAENESVVLTDAATILLAPLLDGRHTLADIIERLRGQLPIPELVQALVQLRSRGYVVDGVADGVVDAQPGPESAAVTVLGQLDAATSTAMLDTLGQARDGEGLVLTDDYLQPELDHINARALADGQPWLLVKPVGQSVWLGPRFVPGKTACWRCLAHRLRGHRLVESYLDHRRTHAVTRVSSRAVEPASSLVAERIREWILHARVQPLEDRVLSFDTVSLERRVHRLVRRPQCPACRPPDESSGPRAALCLQPRIKAFTADGGHRAMTPRAAFERLEHHISPVTGIVASLHPAHVARPAAGIAPPYIARHAWPGVCPDLGTLFDALARRAGGKGRTDEQARMSALGEALERYSGVFQGDEPRIRASFVELGDRAIHPNECMNFSEHQIATSHRRSGVNNATWVASHFDESMQIEWSPVRSLTHETTCYLPTAYCYYGYAEQHGIEFARADSNGCAAGSNLEEAILQGFMEIIERDAVAIWWYNRLARPGVDLDSFAEPYIDELRALYHELERELWVLDVSSDLDIPVFAAVSRRTDKPVEDLILGFGAHLDPRTALLRALTELNQSLSPVASVTAEGHGYVGVNRAAIDWWRTASLANQPYLRADASVPVKRRSDYRERASDDLCRDILTCVESVRARSMVTLLLDQTRADIGLDVVKVIVPGMRHFWPRFGPGRLYDVPVAQGWLAKPRREDQLNSEVVYF